MQAFRIRAIKLAGLVIVLLGAGAANARSEYRYSGFDDATCSGTSGVGANDVARLKKAGATAYIDNLDPAGACVAIGEAPRGSHYSGFAEANCSAASFVGVNDIPTLRKDGAVAYINNRDTAAGCIDIPAPTLP